MGLGRDVGLSATTPARVLWLRFVPPERSENLLADLNVLPDLKGGVFSTRCLLLKGEDDILDSSLHQAFGEAGPCFGTTPNNSARTTSSTSRSTTEQSPDLHPIQDRGLKLSPKKEVIVLRYIVEKPDWRRAAVASASSEPDG
jgi:hypothetical protein